MNIFYIDIYIYKGVGVDEKNYTETTIILLLAIPYLIDFLTGIMTFYLACCVIRLDDERNPPKNVGMKKYYFIKNL